MTYDFSLITYDLSNVLYLISYTLLDIFVSWLVVWCRLMILLNWLARPPRLKADNGTDTEATAEACIESAFRRGGYSGVSRVSQFRKQVQK